MTILAGIYSRNIDGLLCDKECSAIRDHLYRNSDDKVLFFRTPRIFIAKVDIGAYNDSGWLESEKSVTILTGEPLLLNDRDACNSRTDDLKILQSEWDLNNWFFTARAQGVFCSVYYEINENILVLITDKLGIRPLYYWESEGLIIFSSAIRIFERLQIVPKIMDLIGVSEMASLGIPLGKRTQYKGIYQTKPAEVIQFSGKNIIKNKYWAWDQISVKDKPIELLAKDSYQKFIKAVAHRAKSDKSAISFLSGGMDSRCIVAALRMKMLKVFTFNFSLPDTQDMEFASEFAEKIEAIHKTTIRPINPDWSMLMANEVKKLLKKPNCEIIRPNLIWSGDGGSVCLGHVHLSKEIIELMRLKEYKRAITTFILQEKYQLPIKIFKKKYANILSEIPQISIHEELNDINCSEPGLS